MASINYLLGPEWPVSAAGVRCRRERPQDVSVRRSPVSSLAVCRSSHAGFPSSPPVSFQSLPTPWTCPPTHALCRQTSHWAVAGHNNHVSSTCPTHCVTNTMSQQQTGQKTPLRGEWSTHAHTHTHTDGKMENAKHNAYSTIYRMGEGIKHCLWSRTKIRPTLSPNSPTCTGLRQCCWPWLHHAVLVCS